ncbi:MAG TPA: ribose ABC transporter substrate-binding protein [Prolixibacteraceae bacterium]|nr:ribose ABC transporter substrate-binding protein [Prolixibacteraceae bacterium]
MKFVARFFLILLIALVSITCQNPKPVSVGFMLHALDKERWESDRDFFVNKVRELGGTVTVVEAGNVAETQLEQARKLLAEGVSVLVVVPVDQFAAAQIVEEAHKKNVPVISYDRLILNCDLDYYVSTDNVEIGELQASYLTTIKPAGKFALIGGAKNDHNSQFLYLGHMNVLAPLIEKGDVNVVLNTFTESWEENEGYAIARDFLVKPDSQPDAFIAGNDAIAIGVIKALDEAGIAGNVLVAGMDADLANLQEIVKGNQTCTVYKPIEKMATAAAEIAMKLGKGEECERSFQTVSNGNKLVPSYLFNGVVVNKQNLKLTVVSEGYQKEEEIFK